MRKEINSNDKLAWKRQPVVILFKILDIYKQIILNMDKVHMILDEMIIEGYISETNQSRILAPLQLLDTVRK